MIQSSWRAPGFLPVRLQTTSVEVQHPTETTASPRVPNENTNNGGGKGYTLSSLVNAVNNTVQRAGRANIHDVAAMVQVLESTHACSPNQALMLLRCFGNLLTDELPERRTQQALRVWKLLKDCGVKLDSSHYNALLMVQVENGHNFSPTDFLAWMEEQRVAPNRATYRYLMARCCAKGDIVAATTILEQMKQESMPANEFIFHSLISGHCISRDLESAKAAVNIMRESGLLVGGDTFLAYLSGMVRGGYEWEEVSGALDAGLGGTDANDRLELDDHALFQLILELARIGKVDAARELIPRLPKKSGFFQEMRNIVPQLIFADAADLAFEIFSSTKIQPFSGRTDGDDNNDTSRDHGTFFLRAMVKTDQSAERIVEVLKSMQDRGINSQCVARVIEACMEYDKLELGDKIRRHALEVLGPDCVHPGDFDRFMRGMSSRIQSEKEMVDFMSRFNAIGMRVQHSTIANAIIPKLYDPERPMIHTLGLIKDCKNVFSWHGLANAGMQFLLNKGSGEPFNDATLFLLHVHFPIKPILWNASLARAYLATGDLNSLVTFFFVCSIKYHGADPENLEEHDSQLFKTLLYVHNNAHRYRPNDDPDQIVIEVLKELRRLEVGLPTFSTSLLKPNFNNVDDDLKTLLSDLEDLSARRPDIWTEEKLEQVLDERRKLHRKQQQRFGPKKRIQITGSGFIEPEEIPDSVPEMERLLKVLDKRGGHSVYLLARLSDAYVQEGKLDKCKDLLDRFSDKFKPRLTLLENLMKAYLNQGNLQGAEDCFRWMVDRKFTMYPTTIYRLCVAVDDHAKVLELVRLLNKDLLMRDNLQELCQFYSRNRSSEEVEELLTALREVELVPSSSAALSSLVTVHLEKEDLESAVQAFEGCAKEHRRLPAKFRLMEKLIQKEDMERMQRVLDASISVIGEERSLYDLAHNFLTLNRPVQAKKLLETPGLRYNHERLDYIMRQLRQTGNIDAMVNLVVLTRGLFGCDRGFLYNTLLNELTDDPDKTLEVWVMMQEEGHPPSNKIRIRVAQTLEKAGKEVPFEVTSAMRRKIDSESS